MTVIEIDLAEEEMRDFLQEMDKSIERVGPGVEPIQGKNTKIEKGAGTCSICAFYSLLGSKNPCCDCDDEFSEYTPVVDHWVPKDDRVNYNNLKLCTTCSFQQTLSSKYPCVACSRIRICDTCKNKRNIPCGGCIDHSLWETDT